MFQKNCTQCNKLMFRKKKSEASRANWLFCSYSCCTIFKNKQRKITETIKFECLYCKLETDILKRNNAHTRKYCSVICALLDRNLNFNPAQNPITAKKISASNLGKKKKPHSIASRLERSERLKGSKSHFWKGGVSTDNQKDRTSVELKLWRDFVYKRDDYTCQECGERGGKLTAHHVKSFAQYPELRFITGNGQTLCYTCHKLTDNYAGRNK